VTLLITAASPAQDRPAGFWPDKVPEVDQANHPADTRTQIERNTIRVLRLRYDAANAERKRQLEQDSAQLLRLAAELENEMETEAHDVLPPSAASKAETIERLAHTVKEKMKLTVAPG
jgi:acyl carrier protein